MCSHLDATSTDRDVLEDYDYYSKQLARAEQYAAIDGTSTGYWKTTVDTILKEANNRGGIDAVRQREKERIANGVRAY